MRRGTGVDLWWCEHPENGSFLSEVRYVKDVKRNGFEWWLNENQKSVWEERHFRNDQLHGIERSWNREGHLSRGYPRYWVNDTRVTKRQYLRECANNPTFRPSA
jgi:hypothetical protein